MKLLIFAHTPPPHHGQSYMVQLMLQGFGGDQGRNSRGGSPSPGAHGIQCYHVNAQVSRELDDIGDVRFGKFFLLIGYCLQAIWCRMRHGVKTLYYIPAPGKKSAIYRDWLVMFLCRPFFPRIILHWHAAGLAKWLETETRMYFRTATYNRMKAASLSVVLSKYNRADAEKLFPKDIRVVNNGIPDPCRDYAERILPRRCARLTARRKLIAGETLSEGEKAAAGGDPQVFKILYLAHCTREKGLFDSIKGVIRASKALAEKKSPLRLQLLIAGNFVSVEEKAEFNRLLAMDDLGGNIRYLGFVGGEQKLAALCGADLFCFPTYYRNENQPVNLIEAMAFGLPILTTRWRSIPELFPEGYRGLVDISSPDQIAEVLLEKLTDEKEDKFREFFLEHFTLEKHLASLAEAIHSVDHEEVSPAAHPVANPIN